MNYYCNIPLNSQLIRNKLNLSEQSELIVDFYCRSELYFEKRWNINHITLIKSDGGNRPYDVQQPVSDELTKVLIPTRYTYLER